MTEFSQMPEFFGRATAVLGDHASLHVSLERLRRCCDGLSEQWPAAAPELTELLDDFLARLKAHFDAEESAGYFGTLVSCWAPAGAQVTRLCAEHREFLETARDLRERAAAHADASELADDLAELLRGLSAHERAEGLLLRQFFEQGAL